MELRVYPTITTADGLATLNDIRDLHDAPETNDTGDDITVAIMDSGIDTSHPYFENTNIEQHEFTDTGTGDAIGHGTACAGLVSQLAPNASIVSLRIFGDSGSTGMVPISAAYQWLYEHADEIDMVNMSWGAEQNVPTINRLHDKLISTGVHDIVAAGNTGARGGSPATATDAFSVGALTESGSITRFSSYNPQRENPDLSAIGKDVKLARAEGTSMGVVLDDTHVKASGTSFAAPIVSGLFARYLGSGHTDPVPRFLESARDIPEIPKEGEGIADYQAAIDRETAETTSASVWSFSSGDSIYLHDDTLETGEYTVDVGTNDDGNTTLTFE